MVMAGQAVLGMPVRAQAWEQALGQEQALEPVPVPVQEQAQAQVLELGRALELVRAQV
jgi:hypothetical protein